MSINELTPYELPLSIYKEYRRITMHNKHIGLMVARKKLTRNFILGVTLYKDSYKEVVLYGSLKIKVNYKSNRKVITGVWNYCQPVKEWEMDYDLRDKLNKKLGLEEYTYA